MICNVHNVLMQPLFTSYFCPFCDSEDDVGQASNRGFIIWRDRPPGSTEYVFKTREGAEEWRSIAGLQRFSVRPVLSATAFVWRLSSGTVKDIELAEGVYEVYRQQPRPAERCVWLEHEA